MRSLGTRSISVDPNATLRETIDLAEKLVESEDADTARLAELVLALYEWVSRGGFLPQDP